MPFHELLYYLRLNGDAVLFRAGGKLRTKHGHTYIESKEGMCYYNNKWEAKTIWCRE